MNPWDFTSRPTDPIPVKDPGHERRAQVRAVAALIRLDALDLLPVLFAPVWVRHPRGVGL